MPGASLKLRRKAIWTTDILGEESFVMPTSPTLYPHINVHAGPSATHPCSSMVFQIISNGSSNGRKVVVTP
jgi:hypothetical protein